jgi:crotonobetainyl-CoA:carnitine CoA-transferase CaiB-like acyl-CoA transferase
MRGVRVLEVAQFMYVPAAAAVLADWGAEVIKVEHPVSGDAQRGIQTGPTGYSVGSFQPLMEHPNRGKRSIGLALDVESGREVLKKLLRQSDVFITNFLPGARERLAIDVDDVRAVNPNVIYVRGSALGVRGPEACNGGYDANAFWSRGGVANGVAPVSFDGIVGMPSPGFGDLMGSMSLVSGIMAALFERERTGHASVVDVSLLGVAAWVSALAVELSLLKGEPFVYAATKVGSALFNPLVGNFKTSDGRWINLNTVQPGPHWADFCAVISREDLVVDERFKSADRLMQNASVAAEIVREEIAKRPYEEWVTRLQAFGGQWAKVQDYLELGHDPQLRANGAVQTVVDADGNERELVASPVQFDETPMPLQRGPMFAEHTDEILEELGLTVDEALQLKFDGVAT